MTRTKGHYLVIILTIVGLIWVIVRQNRALIGAKSDLAYAKRVNEWLKPEK